MKTVRQTFDLSNAGIDNAVISIEKRLVELKLENRDSVRLRLSVEEILLRWQEHFSTETEFVLTTGARLGQPYISVTLKGEECDPIEHSDDDIDILSQMMTSLGIAPSYSYSRGENRIWIRLKRRRISSEVQMFIAIAAAAVIGIAGMSLAPEKAMLIAEAFITPVCNTLLGLITAVAVPMIFLSVLLGVCGVGDTSTLSKLGSKLAGRFTGKIFLYAAVVGVLTYPLFDFNMTKSGTSIDQFTGSLEMILNIFPKSMIEPFVSGNILQLIVIAVVAGLAMLILGDRADTIKRVCEDANSIVYMLLEWVNMLMPVMIFALLLESICLSDFSSIGGIWKPLAVGIATSVLLPAYKIVRVAHKYKMHVGTLFKKIAPVLLIAITTSSSSSAYASNMNCYINKLGVDKKLAHIGLPLAMVAYMPTTAIFYLTCLGYTADVYNVECSIAWFITAWITASLMAIATPPIAGGATACYTAMFVQMGIPAEALVLIFALDILIDRFNTTAEIAMQQMEMILLADDTQLLDKDMLRKGGK